jgi:CHAD domain-containing protein
MAEDLLGEMLIENNFLTEEQLQEALEKQKESGAEKQLSEILVEEGYITQRALDTVLDIQRHRREEREKVEEEADTTAAQQAGIDPVIMGAIKREIRQLRQEMEKFRHDFMDEVRRYVKQQIRRATK